MQCPRGPFAWRWVGPIVVAELALLITTAGRYGYHRDELYFRVAGGHPAFGYDDQPPLTPFLARLSEELFGESPRGLRVVSALAMGVVVVLVAAIARELGATARGQLIAAAATAAATVTLAAGHIVSTSTFDVLFWIAILWLLVRLLQGGDPRLWVVVGTVAGVGLQNKHLVLLLLVALALGIALARAWVVVHTRWLPIGALVAVGIWLPNLAWQAANGWPQLELGRQIADDDPVGVRIGLIPLQFVILGLLLVPLAVAGLWWLFRSVEHDVRAIGYAYLSLLGICLAVGAKPYYPAPFTLFLLAPGSLVADRWLHGRGRGSAFALGGVIVVSAALAALVVLPLVPVQSLHSVPSTALNEVSRESVGWPRLAAQVEHIWRALPAADRVSATIYASNYGEQGAIARYGPALGLPRAYSGHNALWRFGRPPDGAAPVIVLGFRERGWLEGLFVGCREAARVDNGLEVENEEQGGPIWVCEGPARPWSTLWPTLRHLNA